MTLYCSCITDRGHRNRRDAKCSACARRYLFSLVCTSRCDIFTSAGRGPTRLLTPHCVHCSCYCMLQFGVGSLLASASVGSLLRSRTISPLRVRESCSTKNSEWCGATQRSYMHDRRVSPSPFVIAFYHHTSCSRIRPELYWCCPSRCPVIVLEIQ